MQHPFQKLRASKADVVRSYDWYVRQIKNLALSRLSPNSILKSDIGKPVTKLDIGSMYLYLYDPKLKKQLPVYDRFPLVFPFQATPDGFIGINLHYLPYRMRAKMLNELYKLATSTTITDTTRLRMSWTILNNASRYPGVKSCVKRYLNTHVRSRFMLINPLDWKTVIFLPVEDFAKMTKEQVFRQTRREA